MICAYDKVYLNMAQRVMGNMLNYAVYDCGYELSEYYNIFLESSYCERFGKGDIFVYSRYVRCRAGYKKFWIFQMIK